MASAAETSGEAPKPKGKGKQRKLFLDNEAALKLAQAIAGVKEESTKEKVSKHQRTGERPLPRHKKPSEAKLKLKETKALLAAQKAQKRKAKRQDGKPDAHHPNKVTTSSAQRRKRVSFA